MTLLVEDGSGVANAVCYANAASVQAYASARNIAIPVDTSDIKSAIIQAMDYIESKKFKYKGLPTYIPGLSWPRGGILNTMPQWETQQTMVTFLAPSYGGIDIAWYPDRYQNMLPSNVVPIDIITAMMYLACQAANNINLMPDFTKNYVQQRSVGSQGIVTIYDSKQLDANPRFSLVNELLSPYMKSGGTFGLKSSRV